MVCFQGALTNSTNGNDFLENADTSAAKPTEASDYEVHNPGGTCLGKKWADLYPLHLAQVPI
jgi:hypothetical protein